MTAVLYTVQWTGQLLTASQHNDAFASQPLCDKCDGAHDTAVCPKYPLPPEEHPDATINKGRVPENTEDVMLPSTVQIAPQLGDGNCLFHSLAYILRTSRAQPVTGAQLRTEIAEFIEQYPQRQFKNKTIAQWIEDMNDPEVQKGPYATALKEGMYGGTLETQVVAHIYKVQILIFVRDSDQYRCRFVTEPTAEHKGYLLYKGTGLSAHYDVLLPRQNTSMRNKNEKETAQQKVSETEPKENIPELTAQATGDATVNTESELEYSQEEKDSTSQPTATKTRASKRNRLTIKKTTTQYSDTCGICGDKHTRRCVSILCKCGTYIHLRCMGYRTLEDFEESTEERDCKCNQRSTTNQRHIAKAQNIRTKNRQEKTTASRNACTPEEANNIAAARIAACIAAAILTAQEQSLLQQNQYVRVHGLNKAEYNGAEGRIIRRHNDKVEVEVAGNWKTIRVHCKNLSFMPTYTVSRCKLNQHRTVEVTCYPEPINAWPQALTGTYYEYLGVTRTAAIEEIKAAYKKLSVTLHPDKNPNNSEKATQLFKQVKEAYECLKDPYSRSLYDRQQGIAQDRPAQWPQSQPTRPNRPKWP